MQRARWKGLRQFIKSVTRLTKQVKALHLSMRVQMATACRWKKNGSGRRGEVYQVKGIHIVEAIFLVKLVGILATRLEPQLI